MSRPKACSARLPSRAIHDARLTLRRESLIDPLQQLFPGRLDLHQSLEVVVLQQIAHSQPVDAFGLRVGQWRIDMPTRLMQAAVSASVLGGAIAVTGESSVPVVLLALVLPFIVKAERIEVRTRGRIVRAHLTDRQLLDDPEAAYATLPEELRRRLTLLEFPDTLDRLRAAALLPGDSTIVELRLPPAPEQPARRVTPPPLG